MVVTVEKKKGEGKEISRAVVLSHNSINSLRAFWKPVGASRLSKIELKAFRASLVVQWLRICLPIQETRVQALVREDPTCC